MVDFYFEIVNWDEDRRESTEERRQVRQRASQDFVAVFADLRRRIRQLLASKEVEIRFFNPSKHWLMALG